MKIYSTLFALLSITATSLTSAESRIASYNIAASEPHDTSRYTQGLVIHGTKLIETTGQYGESAIYSAPYSLQNNAKNAPNSTYRNTQSYVFANEMRYGDYIFGEGATVFRDRLWVLTWKNQLIFEFDLSPFKLKKKHKVKGQWWGLTHDGERMIASNGSSTLQFLAVVNGELKVTGSLDIRHNQRAIKNLNELEYVNGWVLANVWQTNQIVAINPNDGNVEWHLDLTEIATKEPNFNNFDNVLNGIAYDQQTKRLLVTGKRWSQMHWLEVPRLYSSPSISSN